MKFGEGDDRWARGRGDGSYEMRERTEHLWTVVMEQKGLLTSFLDVIDRMEQHYVKVTDALTERVKALESQPRLAESMLVCPDCTATSACEFHRRAGR